MKHSKADVDTRQVIKNLFLKMIKLDDFERWSDVEMRDRESRFRMSNRKMSAQFLKPYNFFYLLNVKFFVI